MWDGGIIGLAHHSIQLLLTQMVFLYHTYFILLSTAWSYLQMMNNFSSPKLRWCLMGALRWSSQGLSQGTSSWLEFDYFSAQASLTLACGNTSSSCYHPQPWELCHWLCCTHRQLLPTPMWPDHMGIICHHNLLTVICIAFCLLYLAWKESMCCTVKGAPGFKFLTSRGGGPWALKKIYYSH